MTTPEKNHAVILLAHGSRDIRWKTPFVKLRELIQNKLPEYRVVDCYLENTEPSFEKALTTLGQQGIKTVNVLPLFLGAGGHIRNDLPELMAQAHKDHPEIHFQLHRFLGDSIELLEAIACYSVKQVLSEDVTTAL